MKNKLNELKEKGVPVYSFSKLNSFNNCEYEYYNTYVLKNRGIDNIYTIMGTTIHEGIEGIYDQTKDINKFKEEFENKLMESELVGVTFPNEKIGDSWKADNRHFLENFNKLDTKIIQEKLIVFEIAEGIWLQGYIDGILPSDKGKPYVHVNDWKTSSKFAGKKLTESGRQLLMYKVGLEKVSNFKVDRLTWFMVKYIYVCNTQKNKKVKKKMCNRGKWVKDMRKQLEKDLLGLGIEEFEIEILLDAAVKNNNIKELPQQVQNKYWIEDCFVEYEATEERIEELINYVINTVAAINNKNPGDEKEWKPREITQFDSFYCSTLCGHRKTCKFYKEFLDKNSDKFKKKDKDDEFSFDNLFS